MTATLIGIYLLGLVVSLLGNLDKGAETSTLFAQAILWPISAIALCFDGRVIQFVDDVMSEIERMVGEFFNALGGKK